MVHVRGKRGRQVTPLFAEDENNAIKVLIQTRSLVGVEDSNVYVFAAPTRNSKKWLRGNDCMNKILNQIEGLKLPETWFNAIAEIFRNHNTVSRSV